MTAMKHTMPLDRRVNAVSFCMLQVDIVAAAYERLSFGRAINAIQALSARGNLFLQERQPWTAFKKVQPHVQQLVHCAPMLLCIIVWY